MTAFLVYRKKIWETFMKKVELLSPAGNYEAFLGAMNAGADAVYLGGEKYGARAYADNFTTEEIISAIRYAHIFGRKVYLTINTLMKEEEYSSLCDYLTPFYEYGLDGVIVQDFGAFLQLKEVFPKLELHASTQMTLTSALGISYLKEMGASRVVPARELSLAEIKEIKEKVDIEIECFVHGAMCYCYSGQCLFSSILGGRSGNRGRCAQPCRLPYKLKKDGKESYPFSLKDMCTISFLPKLIEAGIDSFKIEGRMKKPEYAAGVTAIYRKYIDMYYEKGEEGYAVDKEDLEQLSKLYIRSEIQDGYYYRHNGKEMITPQKPSYLGLDENLSNQIRKNYVEAKKKIPVKMKGQFYVQDKARLMTSYKDIEVSLEGDLVDVAKNRPMSQEDIEKQLLKVGNTVFECEKLEIHMDSNIFIPNKALNELRRCVLSKLEDELIIKNGFPVSNVDTKIPMDTKVPIEPKAPSKNTEKEWIISISTKEQLAVVLKKEYPVNRVYLDYQLLLELEDDEVKEYAKKWQLGVVYPRIIRKNSFKVLDKIYEKSQEFPFAILKNVEALQFLKQHNYKGAMIFDYTMYIWNSGSALWAKEDATGFCYPVELNKNELHQIDVPQNLWKEQLVYSYLPLMVTANCLKKTTDRCGQKNPIDELYDRYQKAFFSKSNCLLCYSEIYNCVPLSLHKYFMEMKHKVDAFRLDFTIEDFKVTETVLDMYFQMSETVDIGEYTTGHYKRGVE